MERMKEMNEKDISLLAYRGDISNILLYQVISKGVLWAVLRLYSWVTGFLLWNLGRPAFTSGDLPYILRTWQGWVLQLLGLVVLVIYTVFDINVMILLSKSLLSQKKIKMRNVIKDAFLKMNHFKSGYGLAAILYVSLIAPLTGATFGITLTKSFVIPEFILSVIKGNFIFRVLYYGLLLILFVVGILHIFTFHFAILRDEDVHKAMRSSRMLMRQNWKKIVINYLLFMIKSILLLVVMVSIVYIVPQIILDALNISQYVYRVGTVFFAYLLVAVIVLYSVLYLYAMMMKLTMLFYKYSGDGELILAVPEKKKQTAFKFLIGVILIALFVGSMFLASVFDEVFPAESNVKVVAHRAGGSLANENTVVGLEAAIENGAPCGEIDVQRTKDGHYIINHDDNFSRCCGDSRTPGEMTLAEIRQLGVKDAHNPLAPDAEVATMEEMLDAAKGRIILYIELKGVSADEQMIEDVYQMVKERDMIDEVLFISLDFGLIEKVEKLHPEIKTGYLCYFSFGDIAKMKCDVLLLEAETATESNVEKIHKVGKEVNVWTVDSYDNMIYFMASDVDGIITDEVAMANVVKEFIADREDYARVLQMCIRTLLYS